MMHKGGGRRGGGGLMKWKHRGMEQLVGMPWQMIIALLTACLDV
jgi:hypothetical protein